MQVKLGSLGRNINSTGILTLAVARKIIFTIFLELTNTVLLFVAA